MKAQVGIISVIVVVWMMITPSEQAMSRQMVENSKKMMRGMCVSRSGASNDLVAALANGQFAEDKKLKCYVQCCLNFMKVMVKGQISYDSAMKQINSQLPEDLRPGMISVLEKCKNVSGEDACDIAFNYEKCGYGVINRSVVPS